MRPIPEGKVRIGFMNTDAIPGLVDQPAVTALGGAVRQRIERREGAVVVSQPHRPHDGTNRVARNMTTGSVSKASAVDTAILAVTSASATL